MRTRLAAAPSTLGAVVVTTTDEGVRAVDLGDDADLLLADARRRFPDAERPAGDAVLDRRVATVLALVDGVDAGAHHALDLDLHGTELQRRVWRALQAVPMGTTTTYTDLAAAVGAPPTSVRAVAGACAANPLAVVVPCHRVVRRDGGLADYRWGVERKRALLEREGALSPAASPR